MKNESANICDYEREIELIYYRIAYRDVLQKYKEIEAFI